METGKFCVIENDVSIGDNVQIGHYVELRAGTVIEDDVFIDSYVKSSGLNRIGARSRIRYGCTLARGLDIGKDCFLSPGVSTTHDIRAPKTKIGDRVFVGTNAVICGGVTIADDVEIGACSLVMHDCPKPGLYVGRPAVFKRGPRT